MRPGPAQAVPLNNPAGGASYVTAPPGQADPPLPGAGQPTPQALGVGAPAGAPFGGPYQQGNPQQATPGVQYYLNDMRSTTAPPTTTPGTGPGQPSRTRWSIFQKWRKTANDAVVQQQQQEQLQLQQQLQQQQHLQQQHAQMQMQAGGNGDPGLQPQLAPGQAQQLQGHRPYFASKNQLHVPPAGMPMQPHHQLVTYPPGTDPMVMAMHGMPVEPGRGAPPPRDSQPVQELVGGNWLFLIFVPYFVATALQDTHLKLGLIIATGVSGGVLLLGLLALALNLRKVWPHILEVIMFVQYVILLGVVYHSDDYFWEVRRTYNFIVHSALAGTCLLSMLVCYPAGYQHAQELVHRMYMKHPEVHRAGLYTTAFMVASFVSSCLLYLVPLCKGVHGRHWNWMNLVWRLIYPCVATFVALLFMRFFPDAYLPNLAIVHGLQRGPAKSRRMPPYMVDLPDAQPPTIRDNGLYQASVDAANKAREGVVHSLTSSPVRTPRYAHAGLSGGGGGSPMFPGGVPMGHDGAHGMPTPSAPYAPHGYMDPPGGLYPPPYAHPPGGPYHHPGLLRPPPEMAFPEHDVYGMPYDYVVPVGNPLMAAYPRSVIAQLGGTAMPRAPYASTIQQARMIAAYNNARRRYSAYSGGGNAYGGAMPPVGGAMGPPGRSYVTMGGAGPYGVNLPLGAMAGAGAGGPYALSDMRPPIISPLRSHYGPPPAAPPGALGDPAYGSPPLGAGPGLYDLQPPLRPPPANQMLDGLTDAGLMGRPVVSDGGMGLGGGYGLGADIQDEQDAQQLRRQVLNRKPDSYGLTPTGGMGAGMGVAGAGFGLDADLNRQPPPATPRPLTGRGRMALGTHGGSDGYGLDSDINRAGGGGGLLAPQQQRLRAPSGAGGYGLDAEVS